MNIQEKIIIKAKRHYKIADDPEFKMREKMKKKKMKKEIYDNA